MFIWIDLCLNYISKTSRYSKADIHQSPLSFTFGLYGPITFSVPSHLLPFMSSRRIIFPMDGVHSKCCIVFPQTNLFSCYHHSLECNMQVSLTYGFSYAWPFPFLFISQTQSIKLFLVHLIAWINSCFLTYLFILPFLETTQILEESGWYTAINKAQ